LCLSCLPRRIRQLAEKTGISLATAYPPVSGEDVWFIIFF